MLAELKEADAEGELAAIYAEIRTLCGAPYVSSLQRHLATRPGWLEWAWALIAPAFRSGTAQRTGWRLAADLAVAPLPPISPDELRRWDLEAAAPAVIRAVCETFIRVSPTNLIFSGLLARLLTGDRPGGRGDSHRPWTAPAALPSLPPLVDPASLSAAHRQALLRFQTDVAGQPFIPGLYRMLAQWPGLLPYLATALAPRLSDRPTLDACQALVRRIDAAVPEILRRLPAPAQAPPRPPGDQDAEVLRSLETYRRTSPQMVVFSRLIRDALPD